MPDLRPPTPRQIARILVLGSALGGCGVATVTISDSPPPLEGNGLTCSENRGQLACTQPGSSGYAGTNRFRLGIPRREVEGVKAFQWNICAISSRRGFRCVDVLTNTRFSPRDAAPMTNRTTASWDDGLCVETRRSEDLSAFECVFRNAGAVQRAEFWTSKAHRVSAFSSGVCICSVDADGFENRGIQAPTGAACLVRDDEVPLERMYERAVDEPTRLILISGPWRYADFSFVCEGLQGKSPEAASALVSGWRDGSIPLPEPKRPYEDDALKGDSP